MKTLALVTDATAATQRGMDVLEAQVHGNRLPFAYVEMPRPAFDETEPKNHHHVLVRVTAASCNYRDAGLLLRYHELLQAAGGNRFIHFGSDFAGVVEAVGSEVEGLKPGSIVIPDATYPQSSTPSSTDGVPTNHATRGWLIMPEDKVRAVPSQADSYSLSTFGLNAQTASSMIRKAEIHAGDRVLVTAGRSNTSLSVLAQLAGMGAECTVLSSTQWTAEQRQASGNPLVAIYDRSTRPFSADPLDVLQREEADFDAIIDPFFDQFMLRVLPHLAHGGRYVTCGLKNQHMGQLLDDAEVNHSVPIQELYGALSELMVGNKRIIGNCIGESEDLTQALEAVLAGDLRPVVDSVYSVDQGHSFLSRSFDDADRFGKVVLDMAEA